MLLKRFLATLCVAAMVICAGGQAQADELITNGGFETGDFTGWTEVGTGATYTVGTPAISGDFSATIVGNGGTGRYLSNVFGATSESGVEFSLSFATDGLGGTRALNFQLRSSTQPQLNVRVLGDGSVQAFNGGWLSVFDAGAANFDEVGGSGSGIFFQNDIAVVINEFGAGFNYDMTLNGDTVAGLTAVQIDATKPTGATFNDIEEVRFAGRYGTVHSIDNVSVLTAVPEPTSLVLLGLAGIGMIARRRRS